MALNSAKSNLVCIRDMISSDELGNLELSGAAGCSERTITKSWSNLGHYSTRLFQFEPY
jgi:hypothetical protein